MRVLILDDQERWRRTLSRLLSSRGCECTLAENVDEALEALEEAEAKNTAFQLITLDHNMPEVNGYQALDLIQDFLETKQRDVVFIVISGDVTNQNVRDYLIERGVHDCIVKGDATVSMGSALTKIVSQITSGKARSFATLTGKRLEPVSAPTEISGGMVINAQVVNIAGDVAGRDKVQAG